MFIHVFPPDHEWTFLNFRSTIEVLSNNGTKRSAALLVLTIQADQNEINFAPIAKNAFMQQKINGYGVKANSKHKLPQKFQFFETMVRSIRFLNVDRKQNFKVWEQSTFY